MRVEEHILVRRLICILAPHKLKNAWEFRSIIIARRLISTLVPIN